MSRQHLILLLVLTAGWTLPAVAQGAQGAGRGTSAVTTGADSAMIADMLAADNYRQAEMLLNDSAAALSEADRLAFRGEVEFRKGHFAAAADLYGRALGAHPETARAHDGLGKLALAKFQIPEAIASFRQAIALDPNQPLYRLHASDAFAAARNVAEQRKQLEDYVRLKPKDAERLAEAKAALATLDGMKGQEMARIEAPEQLSPIFLAQAMNLIFVQVLLNGKGPFIFALDSGASITAVNRETAEKAGLTPVTTTVLHGIGGNGKSESRVYRLDTLQIGDVKIHNLPAGALDDPVVSQVADGVIGTALLSDFRMTIDYVQDRMRLTRISDPPAPSPEDAIPAWNFSNLMLIAATVNDHTGNFLVDTGAVASVLAYSMAAELGVTPETPEARSDVALGGIGGAETAVLVLDNVRITTPQTTERLPHMFAIDLAGISKMLGTEISGILGYDALNGYALTLDYTKPEIHFTGGVAPEQPEQ